jgi:hypothetical protein
MFAWVMLRKVHRSECFLTFGMLLGCFGADMEVDDVMR